MPPEEYNIWESGYQGKFVVAKGLNDRLGTPKTPSKCDLHFFSFPLTSDGAVPDGSSCCVNVMMVESS